MNDVPLVINKEVYMASLLDLEEERHQTVACERLDKA
jgi:hypothetical protein